MIGVSVIKQMSVSEASIEASGVRVMVSYAFPIVYSMSLTSQSETVRSSQGSVKVTVNVNVGLRSSIPSESSVLTVYVCV